jgi:transcriptional regulator with XRE-family HTH domain
MNLSTRIQTVLAEVGIDQVELARVMGVTKGTVNQLLNGSIQSLKLEYAVGVQDAFGYNAVWLVLGKGPKKGNSSADEAVDSSNRGQNPVLSAEAERLIQCVMRLDKGGAKVRQTFAYTLGILEIVERLGLVHDADVVAELAEQEQLLALHAEPSRVLKHAPRKHK